jgi:hypothetical protein
MLPTVQVNGFGNYEVKKEYEYPVEYLIVPTDGVLPQTVIPFLPEHKKGIKKVKTAPASLVCIQRESFPFKVK